MSMYSRAFLLTYCADRSGTVGMHIEILKRTLQYMICKSCNLAFQAKKSSCNTDPPFSMIKRISPAEIMDADAVLSTTIIRIHRHHLDFLEKLRPPLDLAPHEQPCRFDATTAMHPTTFLAPISTKSIDVVQLFWFLVINPPIVQCPVILPQLCETLINIPETNLPSTVRRPHGPLQILIADSHHPNMDQHQRCNVRRSPPICALISLTRPLAEYTFRWTVCNTPTFKALDGKDERTATSAPSDRPLDASVSGVTQSNSSNSPIRKGAASHLLQ